MKLPGSQFQFGAEAPVTVRVEQLCQPVGELAQRRTAIFRNARQRLADRRQLCAETPQLLRRDRRGSLAQFAVEPECAQLIGCERKICVSAGERQRFAVRQPGYFRSGRKFQRALRRKRHQVHRVEAAGAGPHRDRFACLLTRREPALREAPVLPQKFPQQRLADRVGIRAVGEELRVGDAE